MVKRKASGGSTFKSVVIGLFIGLALAAVVVFMVMRSPAPFVDRASRSTTSSESPTDPRVAPDPNAALGAGSSSPSPITPPTKDEIGALIATLPIEVNKPPKLPPAPTPKPLPPANESAKQEPRDIRSYYLQAGAFRVLEDAEALRARLLLLGLPVEIQRAEVNGMQVNRVRAGPFAKLDEMNRARTRLSEEKIVSTIIRQ
jgi:cell division protein FtsN